MESAHGGLLPFGGFTRPGGDLKIWVLFRARRHGLFEQFLLLAHSSSAAESICNMLVDRASEGWQAVLMVLLIFTREQM
jgi:hypothetical protein